MPDPSFETFLTSQGLNSLCQKGCHILVKNWIFDDPFHKKGPVMVILVPCMIQLLGSGRYRAVAYLFGNLLSFPEGFVRDFFRLNLRLT